MSPFIRYFIRRSRLKIAFYSSGDFALPWRSEGLGFLKSKPKFLCPGSAALPKKDRSSVEMSPSSLGARAPSPAMSAKRDGAGEGARAPSINLLRSTQYFLGKGELSPR